MLPECIAMSAYSSNFNSSKIFTTFIFTYEFYHFKIYNFISVSQTQTRENPDNLNMVDNYRSASNNRHLTKLVGVDAKIHIQIMNFAVFINGNSANSITLIINFKYWLTLLRVNYKHWPWSLLQYEDFLLLHIIFYNWGRLNVFLASEKEELR